MRDIDSISKILVKPNDSIKKAFSCLEQTSLGILLLVDEKGIFKRTITDGDLRRLLLSGHQLDSLLTLLPKTKSIIISPHYSRQDALQIIDKENISHLPVVNNKGMVVDLLIRKDIEKRIFLSAPHIGSSEKLYIDEAFETNWIAPLGPNVDAFEIELANKVGIKYAAALSSGTAAIHLGLRLLGVAERDKVFCSSLTFAASCFPILYQSAEPIFIDSDRETWNMSPKALEKAFIKAKSERWLPKAVIVVNLYGQSADMDVILDICNKYNVPLLEDAAESLGAKYKGKASGTFGKLGCYSFNGNKIITTSGGGMLVSDDSNMIEKAKFLSTQARDHAQHYEHSELGFNYRMSNILAGVGRGQLNVLEERVNARRKVFEYYQSQLSDIHFLKFMPEPEWSFSNRWLTTMTIDKAAPIKSAELIKILSREIIEARPVWKPMHLQPIFSGTRYFKSDNESVSDDLFLNGICLPSSSNISEQDLEFVVRNIRKSFGAI